MRGKVTRVVTLLLCSALLATLSGLGGCAEKESRSTEVVIGFLGDFTGPSSEAIGVVYDSFTDYLRSAEEENPLPGLKLRVITYDRRGDYGRIPAGYLWLKNQGASVVLCPASMDVEMLAHRLVQDEIPAVSTSALEAIRAHDWAFFQLETLESQHAALLQWIEDTWDYTGEGRSPRVGAIGFGGIATCVQSVAGMEQYVTDNPGKIEWLGAKYAPVGTSAWAIEVGAMKDADYVVPAVFGATGGMIVKEARLRGYTGGFITTSMTFPGYWDLVRSIAAASDLYEIYHSHQTPWCDECSFATGWKAGVAKYRPGAYADKQTELSGYASGWALGIWMVDVMRRAADEVGAENVNGSAIQDALAATDLDLSSEGWGGTWEMGAGHVLIHTAKTYQWSTENENWVPVCDWFPIGPA